MYGFELAKIVCEENIRLISVGEEGLKQKLLEW